MTKQTTDVVILLDRSGSMTSCRKETIDGLNSYVEELRNQEGNWILSLIQFDLNNGPGMPHTPQSPIFGGTVPHATSGPVRNDITEVVYAGQPIERVRSLTEDDFVPRGMTPLYDAFSKTASAILESRESRGPILLVVITDGMENASVATSHQDVKNIMEQLEKQNIQVVFLGADFDSSQIAHATQTSVGNTANFAKSDFVGTMSAMATRTASWSSDGGSYSDTFYSDTDKADKSGKISKNN